MKTAANESVDTSKISTPSAREIRIERVFKAPRDRVWSAFTNPKLINKLVVERIEVERGGHWRFRNGVSG